MGDVARYEIKFDLGDDTDKALWEKLEPYLKMRRAAYVVRNALAQILLSTESAPPGVLAANTIIPKARRLTPLAIVGDPAPAAADGLGNDEAAADAFLSMFG